MLVDPEYQQSGKYKYYVVLQGDDKFNRHPYRAVALINSLEPPYITTVSQHPLRNIREQCFSDPEIIDHGYVDLSYILMLPADVIRASSYVTQLTKDSMGSINKKIMNGLGIVR